MRRADRQTPDDRATHTTTNLVTLVLILSAALLTAPVVGVIRRLGVNLAILILLPLVIGAIIGAVALYLFPPG
jgi:hypothetical protein